MEVEVIEVTASAESEKTSIAYCSAGTLVTTLDHFNAVGIPNVIDRNTLPPSFSGSSKYEVLSSLRFFGMIDKDGKPDRALIGQLVNTDTRNDAILGILQTHYATLFALPLMSAGPGEVRKWFTEHAPPSVIGRAQAFFIALAKQVGVPMHSMVAKGARAASGSIRRKRRKKLLVNGGSAVVVDPTEDGTPDDSGVESEGETRIVPLRGGAGSVSVSVTVNLWDLEGDDMAFVLGLMKTLKAYERNEKPG